MVKRMYYVTVETHDEFYEGFCESDTGDSVEDPMKIIKEYLDDKFSDYYNFSIIDYEEFVTLECDGG